MVGVTERQGVLLGIGCFTVWVQGSFLFPGVSAVTIHS